MTADNAKNNDTMLDELARLFPFFRGKNVRVRCFAHVIALIVKVRATAMFVMCKLMLSRTLYTPQACLSQFSRKRAAKGETKADVAEAAKRLAEDLSDAEADDDDMIAPKDSVEDDRDGTDDMVLNALEEENPDLVLTREEIALGQTALEKVRRMGDLLLRKHSANN